MVAKSGCELHLHGARNVYFGGDVGTANTANDGNDIAADEIVFHG